MYQSLCIQADIYYGAGDITSKIISSCNEMSKKGYTLVAQSHSQSKDLVTVFLTFKHDASLQNFRRFAEDVAASVTDEARHQLRLQAIDLLREYSNS